MPTPPAIVIQNIAFTPDGDIHLAYYMPELDVKAPGVARLHTLLVPSGFDYDTEMGDLTNAAVFLIRDVLDDFDKLTAPPADDPS